MEEAVEAEVGPVQIDGFDGAAGTPEMAQGFVFAVGLAEVVDGLHKGGVGEVEGGRAQGFGEENNGLMDEGGDLRGIGSGVMWKENVQVPQGGLESGFGMKDGGIEEGEIAVVEFPGDGAGAAEGEDPQLVSPDNKIAGTGIGMEEEQGVDLIVVEVPEGLADLIALGLGGGAVGEAVEELAIDPVHGEDAVGASVRMEGGEPDILQTGAGGGEFLGTAQLHTIVGLFQQAGSTSLK